MTDRGAENADARNATTTPWRVVAAALGVVSLVAALLSVTWVPVVLLFVGVGCLVVADDEGDYRRRTWRDPAAVPLLLLVVAVVIAAWPPLWF